MIVVRIVPGRVINIKSEAMTSYTEDGAYVAGTPGAFSFASMELGALAVMELPPPMPLVLTVGILVGWPHCWHTGRFASLLAYW